MVQTPTSWRACPFMRHMRSAAFTEQLTMHGAGFKKLTCLSLHGENVHPLALHALAGLPSLRSLVLHGMRQLTDSSNVGPVLASLPSLQHLDLSYTSLGNGIIESLTYSRRLASWESQKGKPPILQVVQLFPHVCEMSAQMFRMFRDDLQVRCLHPFRSLMLLMLRMVSSDAIGVSLLWCLPNALTNDS